LIWIITADKDVRCSDQGRAVVLPSDLYLRNSRGSFVIDRAGSNPRADLCCSASLHALRDH
jgi:hypothetical protein